MLAADAMFDELVAAQDGDDQPPRVVEQLVQRVGVPIALPGAASAGSRRESENSAVSDPEK